MAQRVLEINVAYAEGLKDVNLFTKMDVFVVVSVVGGNSNVKQKTNVHRDSGTHPTWNFPMRFTIDESCAIQGRLSLIFRLKCEGNLTDTDIGEVCVPIKDLLDSFSATSEGKSSKFVHYQVTKPSGRGQGMLTFSYKFDEIINGTREPVKCPVEATQPITYPPPPQRQQPMGPGMGNCGLSSQETYQPNLYPQPPGPYPHSYPALPEQAGYIYSQPPAPYPHLYPPPPAPANGSPYIHPPPASPGPNYAYPPHQQQQPEQVYPPASPVAYIYPPQQQSPYPYPYPPQPEHQYPYPPQVYPGYGYPPHLQQP